MGRKEEEARRSRRAAGKLISYKLAEGFSLRFLPSERREKGNTKEESSVSSLLLFGGPFFSGCARMVLSFLYRLGWSAARDLLLAHCALLATRADICQH